MIFTFKPEMVSLEGFCAEGQMNVFNWVTKRRKKKSSLLMSCPKGVDRQ